MKVGVIGSGAISDIYLKNMIEVFENLEVCAIASRTLSHAQEKAEKYGINAVTVEELLADREIEMVVNLTPVGAHYDIIKSALLAGKHVYTEKVMTDSAERAVELAKLADSKGLYLGTAPDTFLGAALQTARRAIDDGILGEIHSFAISANRDNNLLLSLFAFLRAPGAGIVNDYGVYYLTALTSLLGPVSRVGSVIGAPYPTHRNIYPNSPDFGKEMQTPNESQVAAVICLRNGITGTFHIDADSNLIDQSYFAIYGTKGILYLTDPNQFGGCVRFLPNGRNPREPETEKNLWDFTPYRENSRGIGPSEMADAIENGRVNRTSKEMGCHVQEVLDAILRGGSEGAFYEIHSEMERPAPLENVPVPIRNIGHISLQMKNEEEMLRFYGDVLQMKQQFRLSAGDMISMIPDGSERVVQHLIERGIETDTPWITYMKLADRQFVELFHTLGQEREFISNRREHAGYLKCNFEVTSIYQIRDRIVDAGITLQEDIHKTADGSLEISVLDPDGNEVQFTEYSTDERGLLDFNDDDRDCCSAVRYTTQAAYQVKDTINMSSFYCRGLGLKKAAVLTYHDLYLFLSSQEGTEQSTLQGLRRLGDSPWIEYLEVGPHQYLELFYALGKKIDAIPNLRETVGYQHLCLEVEDIQQAWKACIRNGLRPDTEISKGADGSWQFWLTDPDGNRIELMEYAEGAKQISFSV